MTLYVKKEIPFKNVYFTGIIRDNIGRKMSKSLGNSPDTLNLINEYGSDGVRFGILLSTQAGNDLKFDEKLCKQGRNFVTKIKNAYKLLNIWKEQVGEIDFVQAIKDYEKGRCVREDLIDALLYEKERMEVEVDKKFNEYRINEAAMILYNFFWDRFCSNYLEDAKPRENREIDRPTVAMFFSIFKNLMILLEPFIPKTAEEYIKLISF